MTGIESLPIYTKCMYIPKSVLGIWTSLTWLKLVMLVWFYGLATDPAVSKMTLDAKVT